MKRGNAKSLTQVACPYCKLGQAVNRYDAHQVFTSYKYIKSRKAKNKMAKEILPTVGRTTNLESVLLDPSSATIFSSSPKPRKMNLLDSLLDQGWFRVILGIAICIASYLFYGWLIDQNLEEEPAKLIVQILFALFFIVFISICFWLGVIIENLESHEVKRWLREEKTTWVCLRCHQTFQRDKPQKRSRNRR